MMPNVAHELIKWVDLIVLLELSTLKGIVHPKIEIMSSFTYSHVIPNMYDLFWSMFTIKMFGNQKKKKLDFSK